MKELMEAKPLDGDIRSFEGVEDSTDGIENAAEDDE